MASKTDPKATLVKNLALAVGSLLITLLLAEGAVRIFVPVRIVGPTFLLNDPVYGKALRRGLSATRTTPEFTMRFTTNSLGFRGPEPEAFPHRPLLFLGDSFTMGWGVSDGEEFPALVRKALENRNPERRIPVINAGMDHNGNGRWVKFLRNEGKRYDPRLVVLQLTNNDFKDNVEERLFTLTHSGALVELPVPPPDITKTLGVLIEVVPGLSSSYLVGLVRQVVWAARPYVPPPKPKPGAAAEERVSLHDQLTFRLLKEVLTICDRERWPVLSVIVGIRGERLAELEKLFQGFHVEMIVVPDKPTRPDMYYKVDGHWNASGHVFVAESILNSLLARGLPAE
jgi:lysophospholipase L1-like esterase